MVTAPLDRKLFRDLVFIKAQIVTIALVVAVGIGNLIGFLSTYDSLLSAQATFYQQSGFAHVFASLKRAPVASRSKLDALPGVVLAEDRIVTDALLRVRNMLEPGVGRFVSIPDGEQPSLNRVHLLSGRLPFPDATSEVVTNSAFAEAHGLTAGDTLEATINGIRREIRIVGIGTSPEFIFAVSGQAPLPDDRHFGIFWMNRSALAAATDMEGAFNSVTLLLSERASERAIVESVDRVLRPYGSIGAIARADQTSHQFLSEEISTLRVQATVVPVIFLLVAAYLLQVVLGRIIHVQRDQIATLKALGYTDRAVSWHFLKMSLVVVLLGSAIGVVLGYWVGSSLTTLYTRFYRFPILTYRVSSQYLVLGVGVSFITAFWGVAGALRGIFRLTPAEAMRPPAPASYHESLLEKSGILGRLGIEGRMIARGITIRPLRSVLTLMGMGFALMILVTGRFWQDSVDYLILLQFSFNQRETATVSFSEPLNYEAVRQLERVEGVLQAEGYRFVPIRIEVGHRRKNSAVIGIPEGATLRGVVDQDLQDVPVPRSGVLMSTRLARELGVSPGDQVRIRVMEGRELERSVTVENTIDEYIAAQLYMRLEAANDLLLEPRLVNAASLRTDSRLNPGLYAALRDMPAVVSVTFRDTALESYEETTAQFTLVISLILMLFASVITVGVVYNNARVALSERDWELSTLRILGFRNSEVFRILIGEIGILLLVAIPIGLGMGYLMAGFLVERTGSVDFELPFVIYPRTFAIATLVLAGAGAFSGYLIARRVRRLDLIETLKSRG